MSEGKTTRTEYPENPFFKHRASLVRLDYRVVGPYQSKEPRLPDAESTLRIALISLPKIETELNDVVRDHSAKIDPDKLKHARDLDLATAVERSIFAPSGGTQDRMLRLFLAGLQTAKSYKPHLICFNELALPFGEEGPRGEAIAACDDAVRDGRCVIVAGSGHDKRTLYNTVYVFPVDDEKTKDGAAKAGRAIQTVKQISATRADSFRELVNVPPSRQSLMIRAFGLKVAVPICIELSDYTTIVPVVATRPRVMLVPCFSATMRSLADIARSISEVTDCMVALVNADFGRENEKPNAVFLGGEAVHGEQVHVTTQRGDDGKVTVGLFTLNVAANVPSQDRKTPNPDLEWLFGIHRGRRLVQPLRRAAVANEKPGHP